MCPFPEGVAAGQRLKYEQYFNHWESNGYSIKTSSFMDEEMWSVVYTKGNLIKKIVGTIKGYIQRVRQIFSISDYDLVYVFMWVTPFGFSFFERVYKHLSNKLIYDLEDNAMMGKSNKLNPLMSILRGTGKVKFLVKNADHVITSSPFLNEDCLKTNINKSCTYVSSSIDMERFTVKNNYSNSDTIVIGWTGTFSSLPYLDDIRDVFLELRKKVNFKLRIIGNFDYDFPGIDLEVIRWSKENEINDLNGIDIGIYPLPKDKWVLGKSGLKAIQYMSLGLPTVATDVGTTPMIINHMENGLLVSDRDDWVNALETLIKDPALRKKLGSKARTHMEENYSTEVIGTTYLSILNKVTGSINNE